MEISNKPPTSTTYWDNLPSTLKPWPTTSSTCRTKTYRTATPSQRWWTPIRSPSGSFGSARMKWSRARRGSWKGPWSRRESRSSSWRQRGGHSRRSSVESGSSSKIRSPWCAKCRDGCRKRGIRRRVSMQLWAAGTSRSCVRMYCCRRRFSKLPKRIRTWNLVTSA